MARAIIIIARFLLFLIGMAGLSAGGAYAGYEAPWLFGLRPGTPDETYGPLVGATAGLGVGAVVFIFAITIGRLRTMARSARTIASIMLITGGALLLATLGAYTGYEAPWLFGLRPGTPDETYGPLVGVTAGLGLGAVVLIFAAAIGRLRRKQPAPVPLPSIDWQELHDPVIPPQSSWPRPDWGKLGDPDPEPVEE